MDLAVCFVAVAYTFFILFYALQLCVCVCIRRCRLLSLDNSMYTAQNAFVLSHFENGKKSMVGV